MKKLLALICVFCLLTAAFAGAACSSGTSTIWSGMCIGAVQRQTKDMCSLSCDSFDGEVTYTIHVNEDEHRLFIHGSVIPKEGELTVTISDEAGNVQFYDTITEETPIGVNLPDYGVYRIQVEAKGFKGSYEFAWTY